MKLSALLEQLSAAQVINFTETLLTHVTHDSRNAFEESLFVALRGERFDGRNFIERCQAKVILLDSLEPLERGEDLNGVERWKALGKTLILVEDARISMAQAAAIIYEEPAKQLKMIGLTGTNGKTTTAWMIEQLLLTLRYRVGVIGTLGHRLDGAPLDQQDGHTTPESCELQRIFAQYVAKGCEVCVMEVSSIGLDMQRVSGTLFDVTAFISFSQDHLDYHESMTHYLNSKRRLFSEHLHADSLSILSDQHPAITATTIALGKALRIQNAANTTAQSESGWTFEITDESAKGTAFTLSTSTTQIHKVWLPLIGQHNVENCCIALAAAQSVVQADGIELNQLVHALSTISPPPGRMERCPIDKLTPDVFVDYAHSPEAIERALLALRPLTKGRLWIIFGCGGDRDRSKRPLMGQIAASLAEFVVITSDNPRSEPPGAIINEINAGIPQQALCSITIIADRARAIAATIAQAHINDVILIAGKGHEQTQTIGERVLPFVDQEHAQKALRKWVNCPSP